MLVFPRNYNEKTQALLDDFYLKNGPCCAGCDHWRWHNSKVGDCTKSAPVGGEERWSMIGYRSVSLHGDAGHIVTPHDHRCGEFVDTFDWSLDRI
jgi:hypothetical protein